MVTGSAWRKNNRRELRHSLGRFLAIVAIVALGVGFFAGLKVAQPAMLRTGSQYVQKTELFDYRLVSTLGLTQEDADYFAGLDGVRAAEGARSVDLTAEFEDEGMTLKALTLSDAVNRPSLTAGRMPERADECLADADRFTEADLGKTLTVQAASVDDAFTQTAFTIVGLAETPLYLGAERGTTSLGGGTLNGFVLLQPEAFAMDYFTEIYLLLDGTQGTDLYSDAYDAAVDAVRPALTAALKERAQKRYDDIIDEARDALSKAQKEYDDGLAEYQEQRAQAEQELADARTQLDDGAQQLEYNRARLTQAESQLASGEKELEAGQKEYDDGLAAFTQAKQDALDQLDAAQAQIDAAQKQLDDSGILVQYEALQITRRQLTERLALQEPGSAEALLTQGLIEATDLLLRQFEQSEAYQGYLQLQQAQAELDAKRSEAMQTLNEKQAELDAAKQKLEDGKKQLESSRSEIAAGWAAVNAAQAELEQGEADYAAGKAEAEKRFADAEAKLKDGRQQLEDAQVEVDKLEHPKSYVLDRSTNTGYVSFENDSSIVAGVAKVFPLFFFAVAALVCITTMTRMIDEQRTQIGTLKALGYSDGTIAWKYMSYSGGAALLGCALGFGGVLVATLGNHGGGSVKGMAFMLIASVIFALAGPWNKAVTQHADSFSVSVLNLGVGGLALAVLGFAMGGGLHPQSAAGIPVLLFLAFISGAGYVIWALLMKNNPVSRIAVFGLIIPIMNVLLSALLNGEPLFEWNYLAALVLVCIGIFLVNRAPQTQETKA